MNKRTTQFPLSMVDLPAGCPLFNTTVQVLYCGGNYLNLPIHTFSIFPLGRTNPLTQQMSENEHTESNTLQIEGILDINENKSGGLIPHAGKTT